MNLTIEGGKTEACLVPPAVACPDCRRPTRWMFSVFDPISETGATLTPGILIGELPIDPHEMVGWVRHRCKEGKP